MAFHTTFHGTSPRNDCETDSAVTFHRAFDVTPDWRRSLEAIANVKGITRILTRRVARAIAPVCPLTPQPLSPPPPPLPPSHLTPH